MHPTLLLLLATQSIILLFVVWRLMRTGRLTTRVMVWTALALIVVEAGFTAWVAADLFQRWNDNPACPACQVLLPGYSDYWDQESYRTWGLHFGINALAGLLVGLGFGLFARRTGGEVLDRDDVYLLALSVGMIGWPNVLVFLAAVFFLGLIVRLFKQLLRARVQNSRVIITPLIPAAALLTIFAGDAIAKLLKLYDLGFVAPRLW